MHDVVSHFEHGFRHALTEADDQRPFFANMGNGDTEEASKENNLEHILPCRCIDDVRRDNMQYILHHIDAVLAGRSCFFRSNRRR